MGSLPPRREKARRNNTERNAGASWYPASLTKMMTLYIVFEELKAGRLTLTTPVPFSEYARSMPQTKLGLGAGTKDLPGQANILRLFVGHVDTPSSSDRVWVLETNLDDLPGEVVGHATTLLMAAGALDAFLTPIQMKKNRPGVMVTVLCDRSLIPAMETILFRETTTLGIRRYEVGRHKLKRQAAEVETPFGTVKGKLGCVFDPDRVRGVLPHGSLQPDRERLHGCEPRDHGHLQLRVVHRSRLADPERGDGRPVRLGEW